MEKKTKRYITATAAVLLTLSAFSCQILKKNSSKQQLEYYNSGNLENENKEVKKVEEVKEAAKEVVESIEKNKTGFTSNKVVKSKNQFTNVNESEVSALVVHRDTTAPTITITDMTVEHGITPDFSKVTAVDNIDGNVTVSIIGNYNVKKAGVYQLTAIAVDKDGNTARVSFKLVVNAHPDQPKLDAALLEMTDLYNKLIAAKQDLSNAKTDLEAVNTLLKSNKEKVQLLGNRVQSLELEKLDAQNNLATKEQELSDAQNRYNAAVEAASTSQEIRNANDVINSAIELIQELTNQKNTEEEELAESRGQLNILTARYEEAKRALDQATNTLEAETVKYNQLKAISDTDAQNKQEAQDALSTALTEYNDAKRIYDEAVTRASDSEEFRTAKRELDEAAEVLENVKQLQVQAQTVADEAAENLNNAITAKQSQDAKVADKQRAKQVAEQELVNAQREVSQAQEALQNSKTNKTTAQRNLDNAIIAYNNAKTANDNAKAELENAKEAERNAQQALDNARQAFQQAQERVTTAQNIVSKGAIGLFEAGPHPRIVENIESHNRHTEDTTSFKVYKIDPTIKGDPLSFENFEESINYLKRGNELRRNDPNFTGREDLKVTDYLMMQAALESAAMPEDFKHRRYISVEGQNSAAGYERTNKYNSLFSAWYDMEKKVYDTIIKYNLDINDKASLRQAADIIERETGEYIANPQIGHYLNLIDSKWKYTGFAVMSQEGQKGWSIIHNHDFSTRAVQFTSIPNSNELEDLGPATPYTVEEYHTRFIEYKNEVIAELEAAKTQLANTEALLAELEASGGLTAAQRQAITNAQNKVNSTQSTLNIATTDKTNKENILNEKTNKVVEAEELLANKRQVVTEKEQSVNEKNNALNTEVEKQTQAQEVVNEKTFIKTEADNRLNEAKSNTQAAQTTKDEKQEVLSELNREVVEKQITLAEKEATKAEKEQSFNTATINAQNSQSAADAQKGIMDNVGNIVTEKTEAERTANEAKESKASEVANKTSELDATKSRITEQEAIVAENREIIENANSEVKATSEAVKAAEVNKIAAQENLSTVNNSIIETKAEKVATEERIVELEATVPNKEAVVAEKQENVNAAQDKYDVSKQAHDALDKQING